MLDLKLIREQPDAARAALARRGAEAADALDRALALDARRRELLPEREQLSATKKAANDEIAAAKRSGSDEDADAAIARMRALGARESELDGELKQVQANLESTLSELPNPPDASAPDEQQVLREVGEAGRAGRDHLELLGDLVDMEAGARVSGTRFAYLKGPLVLLELALVRWGVELLLEKGFVPAITPALVREQALYGTGFLPDTEQQIYALPEDDLYLAGTSEVALASLHAEQILDAGALPLRYAGFSSCFRREAGAAGKDTRGIFRVHQFDKLEMFAFVEPEQAADEHERLLAIEEEIFQALEIPYRVVNIPVDDLGSSAVKKYDLEAWLPGQRRYRELTSCSNTTDFQARRLDVRYRPDGDGGVRHVATLNGTAIAVGRTIIALVENGQREDGTIEIPAVLHPFGAPETIATGNPAGKG